MSRRPFGFLALAATMLLSACAVGPDYVAPASPITTRYTASDPSSVNGSPESGTQILQPGTKASGRWWEVFGSASLNHLVEQALADSPTIDSAHATLAQAEAVLRGARAGLAPQIDIGASVQRSNGSSGSRVGNLFTVGPTLHYTADIFGGTRRRIEQAQALRDFQQAQWDDARLTLAGNTVLQAIALASISAQIAAVRDIIAVDERNLELVNISTTAGKSALLDVLTAQSQLANDRALLPPLQQQASVVRHTLAVFAGKTSADWAPPDFDLATLSLPPSLPLTLPTELLQKRPDIVAAEAQLRATNAGIGIATAQLYPSFTLSGSWSSVAPTAGGLFASSSNLWSMAASMLAPLFDGGFLKAQQDQAIAAYSVQLGNYRQTVLEAFRQVADILDGLQHDATFLETQHNALDSAKATLDLTQESYQAGQASLLQLLESQRQYQEARLGYAKASGQRYTTCAQLFIAMGGVPDAVISRTGA